MLKVINRTSRYKAKVIYYFLVVFALYYLSNTFICKSYKITGKIL